MGTPDDFEAGTAVGRLEPSPSPSSGSEKVERSRRELVPCAYYVNIWPGSTDAWCNTNCFATKRYCPKRFCRCDRREVQTSPPPPTPSPSPPPPSPSPPPPPPP
eukprot:scaffold105389_cov58-Phaeocystis_antarctica.AAC.1